MIVIRDDSKVDVSRAVVAIGKFDGVHYGHACLLSAARKQAAILAEDGKECAWGLVTFDAHPMEAVRPGSAPPLLTPLERKLELLSEFGPNFCLVLGVHSGILHWPAERFEHEILVERIPVAWIVAGEDFRYGKDRTGNLDTLRSNGSFGVTVVPTVLLEGHRISSYDIREALYRGDIERATMMLQRPYDVTGPVVKGRQLGRTLGFPTANLRVSDRTVLPGNGVYVVRSSWKDSNGDRHDYPGVANIGLRPTMNSLAEQPVLEVHIPGWSGDLYGADIKVAFIRRLRDEMKFDSLEELKSQIRRDIDAAQ